MEYAIFDMDGLMIDTETIYLKTMGKFAKEKNVPIDKDLMVSVIGTNANHTKEVYLQKLGKDFDYDNFISEYRLVKEAYIKTHPIKKKKGIRNILRFLKKNNIKLAVATSTNQKTATQNLKNLDLYKYFDYFVFGDQIINGKPAPDIYLKALEKANISNKNAIVFEDSRNGLLSATNAKIKSIVVKDICIIPEKDLKKAYVVLDDLNQAIPIIKDINMIK